MNKAQRLLALQIGLFITLSLSLVIFPSEQNTILRVIGLLLAIFGGVIGLLAIRQHKYGLNAVPTPRDSAPLITAGLYAQIRHPIYTGVLLAAFGLAVFHGHLVPLLIAFAFVPFFTYKSRYEEKLLRQVYPEYTHYMTYTGRFWPPGKIEL
jgi:protein-S-isoprenylcysteine O-methyltransferase Ste14